MYSLLRNQFVWADESTNVYELYAGKLLMNTEHNFHPGVRDLFKVA